MFIMEKRYRKDAKLIMKKLDTNKLTDEQIKFFNEHLPYMATVNKEGKPAVGPKASLKAIDATTVQYLEKTKSEAFANLKNGSEGQYSGQGKEPQSQLFALLHGAKLGVNGTEVFLATL